MTIIKEKNAKFEEAKEKMKSRIEVLKKINTELEYFELTPVRIRF